MWIIMPGVASRWVMYSLGINVAQARLINANAYTIGSSSQPRLREATMVITVQIIRLTREPTFSRLRFCPFSPPGKIRASRAKAWHTSAITAERIAIRRQPLFFCSRAGTISARLTE
ncbi:hypothetical protein D3C73_1413990 [compost metagenome]